jgi:hypothetical protein
MPIRVKADDLGYGMLLSGIRSREDALQLHRFFASNSLEPVMTAAGLNDFQILLYGVSRDAFEHVIGGADVELT